MQDFNIKTIDMSSDKEYEHDRDWDFPHDDLMGLHGINVWKLPRSIQRQVESFDVLEETALEDGFIDKSEGEILEKLSILIAKRIRLEYLGLDQ